MPDELDYLLKLIESREKGAKVIRAVMGDGAGNVAVSGMTQHVWIRPYNRNNPVVAFATDASGYPEGTIVRAKVIHVGGKAYYVVGEPDHEAYGHGATPSGLGTVPAHGGQHQWGTGGIDPVFIHPNQFTPLLMYPTTPVSMSVYISAGYWRHGGLLKYWPGGDTVDLTPYLPDTDYGHYLLVYFDASSMQMLFTPSTPFAASIAIPSAYSHPVIAPPNSVVAGYVLMLYDTTEIDASMVFPFRSLLNVEHSTDTAQTWLLATREDSLWQSVGGYLWTQLGSGVTYLEEGIHHVVVVDADHWLVFREQADAVAGDPIVYGTDDRGLTWDIKQSGMTFVQGTDLWCSYAVTQNPANREQIAVAIMPTAGSKTPEVYITEDGGQTWVQVSGTGLPTFTVGPLEFPMSLAVQNWSSPHLSLAFGEGGLYRKFETASWAQEASITTSVWTIHADRRSETHWVAVCGTDVKFTSNSWTSKVDSWLAYDDYPSPYTHTVYQHPTDLYRFAVGGVGGVHTTLNGEDFMRDTAMEIGMTGSVLTSLPGLPAVVFVTRDSDGGLLVSGDGCTYLMQSLALSGVVSLAGMFGDTAQPVGGTAEFSQLELWLRS